jgi:uncharacterized protein (DUF2342 family)
MTSSLDFRLVGVLEGLRKVRQGRPWLYRVVTNACLESMSAVWFPASSETFL